LQDPSHDYIHHLELGMQDAQAGRTASLRAHTRLAVAAMDRQIEVERRMIAIRPDSSHYACLAHLLFDRSFGQNVVLGSMDSRTTEAVRQAAHRKQVAEAILALETALELGGPLGHTGRKNYSPAAARTTLARWRQLVEPGSPGLASEHRSFSRAAGY
jgi:hypothetical protein